MKTISAVLLAGGASVRHGRNKLTLPLGDSTVIQQCAESFTAFHLTEIIVVTGYYHDELSSMTFRPPVRLVNNPDHAMGMSSSVRCGLSSLQDTVKGVFLCPADMPLIRSATLVQLIHAFDPGRAVIPRCGGKRGHPILLSWEMTRWCIENKTDNILHHALDTFKSDIVEVDVDDEGVLIDLDRPEDYQACIARWERFNGKSGL